MLFTVLLDSLKFFFLGVEKMKKQYLSFLSYLALPCLLSTMSLRADDMNSSEMNSCDEGAKSNFVSTYDRIKDKEITPNAGPAVNGGADIFIEADYIYWYVSQDGLNYAAGGVLDNKFGASNNVFSQQSRAGIKGKMASGFKVAGGLDLDYDGWDTLAQYTWLHVNSRSHHGDCYCDPCSPSNPNTGTTSAGVGPYYPMLDGNFNTYATTGSSNYASYMLATGATGQWRLHFNVIDWEVGRSFFISPKLVLRPHMGFKGTWQKQWYDIDYTLVGVASPTFDANGNPNDFNYTNETEVYSVYNLQRYWGIGTRMGLDSSWMISKCFSIFGEMAASTMFGYFKDTRTDVSNVVDTTTDAVIVENNTRINLAGRKHQVNAVLETQIGLRYDYLFSDDEYRFRLQAGWESQLWFNQNQFLADDLANQQGANLGFQGLTVNVRFDF